ncbi:hypothetical protein ASE74_15465 [Pedobacter sp. Leaf216]|uniref:hypothetical protein n=1 Tax=Pedobacter sp. Leaf216 TaxID=1735684 RepID=UPI0006F3D01A|nr:hypothetical protein [Pedobacter sp. Leaf216]KQM78106.1 hypothetical protein ASE74_15465 [Pedobacter sp. Leaf216]
MKTTFTILIFLIPLCSIAQKTGIVSDINYQMGYVYLKGALNPKVLAENDLDFNVLTYLTAYLNKQNVQNEQFENFDFKELEYFDRRYKYKKMVAYAEEFCIKNNLNQIIIIRKKNSYKMADPRQMFYGFHHDFGIATLSMYDKRPILFYNFSIIRYLKGSSDFKVVLTNSYKNQKFDDVVFDKENYKLINDKVLTYFQPVFEALLNKALDK